MALDKWFWLKLVFCPFILLYEAFAIYFMGCFGIYAGGCECALVWPEMTYLADHRWCL